MISHASELPTERIRGRVDRAIYETFGGEVYIAGLYIYGSFGADQATRDSDIDLLISLDPNGLDDTTATDVAHILGGGALVFEERIVDPVALPSEKVSDFLTRACNQRGYQTVYDVHAKSYRSPSSV